MRRLDRRHHAADPSVDTVQQEVDALPEHVGMSYLFHFVKKAPGEWLKKFGVRHAPHAKEYTSDHFRNAVIGWWNRWLIGDEAKERIDKLKAEHDARVLRRR